MTLAYSPPPIIESGEVDDRTAATTLPTMVWIGQASGLVVATVRPPALLSVPITAWTLSRAPTVLGPWTVVDIRASSPQSNWVNLFDAAPAFDARMYYAVSIDGVPAPLVSNTLYFVAHAVPTPIAPGSALSAGAFGRYPVLGSDVFVDPTTGEGAIGPNGDLLVVNGLDCLAQDLRTRMTTEQGELLLHSQFGLTRERLIGSGQASPTAQAQMLQARFIAAYRADKRVLSIQSLTISAVSWSAWMVDVTLVAIGVEDPARLNIVVPFVNQ